MVLKIEVIGRFWRIKAVGQASIIAAQTEVNCPVELHLTATVVYADGFDVNDFNANGRTNDSVTAIVTCQSDLRLTKERRTANKQSDENDQ